MEDYRFAPESLSTNPYYIHLENQFIPWAPLQKPLSASKVCLVTMGGLYLPNQRPFSDEGNQGDHTFRVLPRSVCTGDYLIAHTHYEHKWVMEDINCLLPIDIFRDLEAEGTIGMIADHHFSFMGSIPNPVQLVADTAPHVANLMVSDGVDVSVLTPT